MLLASITISTVLGILLLIGLAILLSIGPLILCQSVIRESDRELSQERVIALWHSELIFRAAMGFPAALIVLLTLILIVGVTIESYKGVRPEWMKNAESKSSDSK